jgi:hypothetical protein
MTTCMFYVTDAWEKNQYFEKSGSYYICLCSISVIVCESPSLSLCFHFFISKINPKGWWSGSSCKNACLATVRPWVQTLVLPEKKKDNILWSLSTPISCVGAENVSLIFHFSPLLSCYAISFLINFTIIFTPKISKITHYLGNHWNSVFQYRSVFIYSSFPYLPIYSYKLNNINILKVYLY